MQTLNWGEITPEASNPATNTFVYVYNHDLSSSENVNRTIRFILGRLVYYDFHLPKNPNHQIIIDIRGQGISNDICEFIFRELK